MNTRDRIAYILHRARVRGGWDDETVAEAVLQELGLDVNGEPAREPAHTSSEIGHG